MRGGEGDAGGHFVVEEAADAVAEEGGEGVVEGVVGAGGVGVDAAGEVAFEVTEDGEPLLDVTVTTRAALPKVSGWRSWGAARNCFACDAEEGVGVAVAVAGCLSPPVTSFAPALRVR